MEALSAKSLSFAAMGHEWSFTRQQLPERVSLRLKSEKRLHDDARVKDSERNRGTIRRERGHESRSEK